ncbi:hypothetical protein Bbelb_437800 [Branchiostoma belcheri]|nr:hypothetical protein Bbelb_437800 [Branchiostoma belcheri]
MSQAPPLAIFCTSLPIPGFALLWTDLSARHTVRASMGVLAGGRRCPGNNIAPRVTYWTGDSRNDIKVRGLSPHRKASCVRNVVIKSTTLRKCRGNNVVPDGFKSHSCVPLTILQSLLSPAGLISGSQHAV